MQYTTVCNITHIFENEWQYPHCKQLGKYIEIISPPNNDSFYFSYKERKSLVLMAMVNANYEFLFADVGTNGRISDGGVI